MMKNVKCTITPNHNESKSSIKKRVKEAINSVFHLNITASCKDKSKTQHLIEGIGTWTPGKRPSYMSNLNREQTSTIFKARTRMLPVKNNYRNQYKDNICRGCKAEPETQQHVLQSCKQILMSDTTKVPSSHYFTEDIQILIKASENIRLILEGLVQSGVQDALTGSEARPGIRTHTR
jgi:hypothetical protein